MTRTILAVLAGLAVVIAANILTGALGSHPPTADHTPALILLVRVLGIVIAGYVAALISRRVPVAHALAVGALSLVISVLAGLINSQQREWGQWAVGAFAAMLFVAIGGFIRSWQLHRAPRIS